MAALELSLIPLLLPLLPLTYRSPIPRSFPPYSPLHYIASRYSFPSLSPYHHHHSLTQIADIHIYWLRCSLKMTNVKRFLAKCAKYHLTYMYVMYYTVNSSAQPTTKSEHNATNQMQALLDTTHNTALRRFIFIETANTLTT